MVFFKIIIKFNTSKFKKLILCSYLKRCLIDVVFPFNSFAFNHVYV